MVVFFGFVWAGMFRTCSCKPLVSDGAVLLFVLLNIFVVPLPPLGVVGRYFSGECSLKCRQGWASGDLSSSSILAQVSVSHSSQCSRVTAPKVTPPGAGCAAPPGAGRVEAEAPVVRVSGSHYCCCYFCSSTDALSQCDLGPLLNWCWLPVSPLNIFLRTIFWYIYCLTFQAYIIASLIHAFSSYWLEFSREDNLVRTKIAWHLHQFGFLCSPWNPVPEGLQILNNDKTQRKGSLL